ncbi:MAG: 1,4-alpha-glucan branching protein domain-containing protein [Oscillochloridaceae bacterium umkhey_bin13]
MHVAFLIIAHVPYVRRAGRKPNGEDALHALLAQGLLPLIELLSDLNASGLQPRVALACSPLLSDQLADPVAQKHFVLWIEALLAHHEARLREAEAHGDHHAAYLERFALEWGRQRLRSFAERLGRTPNQTLRALAAARVIEPLAGAASYAYLPLLAREESVRAQIEHGTLHTTRHQGRPEGLWLPGCGWRPGLEKIAAAVGLNYLVADPSSLPAHQLTTPALIGAGRLAVLFPDQALAQAIWSEELGYPGDPLYRDPDDPRGYRARGGQPYDPYFALRRAQEHATHFVMSLVAAAERRPANDLALILLDASQIGPRWVEGSTWLQAVLTLVATHGGLTLTTPGAYLRQYRPRRQIHLGPGSWAVGGHAGWQGAEAEAYWQALHAAEARMVALATEHPQAEGERERILTQAARELLLAQTSDWPALLSAGHNGAARWRIYLERFDQLAELATQSQINAADRFLLEQFEELDGPFGSLNYRIFAS